MADDFADLREAMRPALSCGLSMVSIKDIVCQDQFEKFKALERDWEEQVLSAIPAKGVGNMC